jgi:hypothetical protein
MITAAIILSSVAIAFSISCFITILYKKNKEKDIDRLVNKVNRLERNVKSEISGYPNLIKYISNIKQRLKKIEDEIRMGMYNDVEDWLDENEKYLKKE